MMSNKMKISLVTLLAAFLLFLSVEPGCTFGTKVQPGSTQGLDVIKQAWDIIFNDYVDKDKLSKDALSQAAIKGMVEALDDPYTAYLDAKAYQLSLSSFEGKIEGIGAQIGMREERLIIIAPIPDSPADKAGVRAGDAILEVDGRSTSGISLTEAVLSIRGAKGTVVRLLILHQEETAPVEIEIIRDEIKLPSVHFEMKGDIAYIRITYFSERTSEELSPVLESVVQEGATGIVLDLRSNPGGILQTVIEVASRFLDEGVVVDVVDNQGKHAASKVKPDGVTLELPMVVLVDSFSASGSEVLAGALRDNGRAVIAGTKTFGKGSVNILRRLEDGSALFITTARWLTPNGHLIEGEGLHPDIELELTGDEAIEWAVDYLKSEHQRK